MTREEAITNHRKMWRWMADESRRTGSFKFKSEYLSEYEEAFILNNCYLCEYTNHLCVNCPLIWDNGVGGSDNCMYSYYKIYQRFVTLFRERPEYFRKLKPIEINWYADLCDKIAGLREREE